VVQTFLPHPDFVASARALDDRRLGKQRVEALQILRAQIREGYGWQNHPAVRMWRGFPEGVAAYALAICDEWSGRGRKDTVADSVRADLAAAALLPTWLGDDRVHRSHRQVLLHKLPEHYTAQFPHDEPGDTYVWPV
jgi:hypothetical protein